MLLVYRIQCPEGIGPYIGYHMSELSYSWTEEQRKKLWWIIEDHNSNTSSYPTGIHDQISTYSWQRKTEVKDLDPKYGFPGEEELSNWFNSEERSVLKDLGYEVGIYSVPEEWIQEGKSGKQCIFNVLKSELLTIEPIK